MRVNKKLLAATVLIWGLLVLPGAGAQQKGLDPEGHPWWQHAVFYELYPRSFADSDNNGIGDLKGISSKLGYLQDLGVDAIWLTPFFPSPQVDFGYDVSDYEAIDPMYGTMEEFDRLAAEAKKKKIRLILDFVVNHSSDKHKWFQDSKSSLTSEHRDWYIWRDGKGPGLPPNNWLSTFGLPAWKLDPKTGQYYYHYFYPEQPDLNWRNPAVEKAMLDQTRFWYRRGVSGFRLDAVDTLFEDPKLTDNPVLPGTDRFGRPNMEEKFNKKLPEVHDVMRKLRSAADEFGAVLIGETWTSDVSQLNDYYGQNNDELQLPMDLLMTGFKGLSVPVYRKHLAAVDGSGHWPVYVISNHDIARSYTRYADGAHNDDIAKMMAAFYLTLRGTAVMYYGEEIGMENNDPKSKEEVQDPVGKLGWPIDIGRDGERTPMQWTAGPNAGFSKVKPWLAVPPSAKTRNVESEMKDPNSILTFYHQLLELRHKEPALLEGAYVPINQDDPEVLSYLRKYKDEVVLVILNMSAKEQEFRPDLSSSGFEAPRLGLLLTNFHQPARTAGGALKLEPYSAVIAKVKK